MWLVVDCQGDVLQDPRASGTVRWPLIVRLCVHYAGAAAKRLRTASSPRRRRITVPTEYFVDVHGPYFSENVEEAQALLAEAGYPGGAGFPEISYEPAAERV